MVVARGFSDFLARALERPSKSVKKPYVKRKHRFQGDALGIKLDLGERIVLYIREKCGAEFADSLLSGTDVSMPHRFWQRFLVEEQRMQYSQRERLRNFRALQMYVASYRQGNRTRAAMLDGLPFSAKRRSGSEKNALKNGGIGHALLQYYIDEVQSLNSRADSSMMLEKARQLRFRLLANGYEETDLPKLDGRAGVNWFERWRHEHSYAIHAAGLQLKVSWRKVLRRVRVLLTNIFRLRIFFEMCHQGLLQC